MSVNSDLSGYLYERQMLAALLDGDLTRGQLRGEEKDLIGVSDLAGLFSDDLKTCDRLWRMSPGALRKLTRRSVHWSAIGDPRAKDSEIMNWALTNGYIVCSC
ncbi:MAG TPA: hypothetical protein VFY40_11310 [Blastocatellia bacterium]|nr:hypothetical protein [Blastocatellia bacterium]